MTHVLMVQGTTSDAGKSVLVAGICRVLARQKQSVAPFKPQNMALNSAVTEDGGEIGRAQALQAVACGLKPHTDMNPVLLKPASDTGAQVIIHGKALSDMEAQAFHEYKPRAMGAVLESLERLKQQYDTIIVEGAGSPAEINLRDKDIANMGFAEKADCPVIIIADIDRGGVFAHLVGTLALLSESEQRRVVGFVINRFRGDIALLQPGLDWLEARTDKPVLGVIPYLHGLYLDAEDAISTQQRIDSRAPCLRVVVPVYSRISNHTDFDALRLHPHVDLHYVGAEQQPPACDLIILPGSKNVRKDRQWLAGHGWDQTIAKHLRYGGKVLGICGGYQMLGKWIADPEGIEDEAGETQGLAYLDLHTTLRPSKILETQRGQLLASGAFVQGYEIHCGISTGTALNQPLIRFENGQHDGAVNSDGNVAGTYLHGLFDQAASTNSLLAWAGLNSDNAPNLDSIRDQQLDRLADTLEQHLNFEALGLVC